MSERKLICIMCPNGCELNIKTDTYGKPVEISGQKCKIGEKYAYDECTNPVRSISSTVKTKNGRVVAVKTSAQIPKGRIFDVMAEINRIRVSDNAAYGDVVIKNVCNTGADIVVIG